MKIELSDEQNKITLTKEIADAVELTLAEAAAEERIDFCASVLFTDNAGIRVLNREYRGIDNETDVLSFPAYELDAPLRDCIDVIEVEEEDGLAFIGDIAISMERAAEQAASYGHSIIRETAFLALHGALHLLGYDHAELADEKIMLKKQRFILEKAGIER